MNAMADGQLRLALRIEGEFWVAYVAKLGTMEGAWELGRVLLNAVAGSERQDEWKALMVACMGAALIDAGAVIEGWDERTAPESERAGKA
jgi:hypothetical protein